MGIQSCITPPNLPDTPEITYTGMSKMELDQGALNQDSLFIFFSFTDGNGDIGLDPSDRGTENFDLIVIDTRTGNIQDRFFLPFVPPKGAANGIIGNAEVLILSTCCLYDDGTPACEINPNQNTDSVIFEVYIMDREGNESNRITTPPITLNCI